jgi:hypothetical protein
MSEGRIILYCKNDDDYYYYYGSTALSLALSFFFSLLILYTVGRTPWMGDQTIVWPQPIQDNTKKINDPEDHASSGI